MSVPIFFFFFLSSRFISFVPLPLPVLLSLPLSLFKTQPKVPQFSSASLFDLSNSFFLFYFILFYFKAHILHIIKTSNFVFAR